MSYVYYSYEEWGRGYIGSRSRDPEGDDYMGSFFDDTFQPTHKIVLAEFDDYKDALQAEIELHAFFDVARNPRFANRCRATSTGFTRSGAKATEEQRQNYRDCWTEERREKTGELARLRNLDPAFQAKCNSSDTRTKRSHWTKEVWDEVATAIENSKGRFHWGKQELIDRLGVSERTLRRMRKLILQGLTFDEATG